jgi:hypothetical protein
LLSLVRWHHIIIFALKLFTQTVQVREMSWYGNDSYDGDDLSGRYDWDDQRLDGWDDVRDDERFDGRDDSDDDSIESASVRRRNIISCVHASSLYDLKLSGEPWTFFATTESFRPDLENLITALQSNRSLETIAISEEFLTDIGESDQGRIFCRVGNVPTLRHMSVCGSSESHMAIHTRVLADALSQTSNACIDSLHISGFKLSSRSEVQQLADGLKNRAASLETLILEDIVLDGEDKTGFLDPILLALSPVPGPLCDFRLICSKAASNGPSLVSPEALGSFLACKEQIGQSQCSLHLQNLGLKDNHCKVMAEQMGKDEDLRPIEELNLCGNPSTGQEGYQALLGLLNRKFNILCIDVDDQNWKAKFDLVISMNLEYSRGLFLKDGVFPSKEMRVNCLAKLNETSYFPSSFTEAERLNAIWYTLREDPDFIYT